MKTVTYDETKWQLVPKEPTEEMRSMILPSKWDAIYVCYKAMLEAAPEYEPPAPIYEEMSIEEKLKYIAQGVFTKYVRKNMCYGFSPCEAIKPLYSLQSIDSDKIIYVILKSSYDACNETISWEEFSTIIRVISEKIGITDILFHILNDAGVLNKRYITEKGILVMNALKTWIELDEHSSKYIDTDGTIKDFSKGEQPTLRTKDIK